MKIHIPLFDAVPARLNVALMMFFACWINYMLRVNMSVNIIAMVPDNSTGPAAKSECEAIAANDSVYPYNASAAGAKRLVGRPDDAYTFEWTAQQQAYVLSGYFWGYAITCLAGGTAAERWGPRSVVFITTMMTSVLTLLSPPAAKLHYAVLVALRFFMGLCAGFLFPALHALLAHWAPPAEKGKFVSALLGGSIGTVVTWSLSGPLLENFGWDYAFYVPGLIGFVWCIVWWILVYDSPTQHPRISEAEKAYILEAIGDKVQDQKGLPPFKSIFTSFPFLAMVILHYGNSWGLYFVMTAAPKFVSSALGFNLASAGTVASLPYLARMIFSLIFGAIGDRIIKKNIVSTTFLRKFFCLFSHILPGLLLIGLGYTGCAPVLSVALITFSMGCNGAATLTNLVNHQDLAPNFAGTLYGIANGIGNTAGFVTPLVTAHFTKNGNGFAEWRPVFMTGASLYIASAIYFMIFGTGVTQPWNYVQPSASSERAKRTNKNNISQNGSATQNSTAIQNGILTSNSVAMQNSVVAQNGVATQNGAVTQNGTAAQNDAVTQNGTASQNGAVTQNGTASQNGAVTQNDTASQNGAVTQNGTASQNGVAIQNNAATQDDAAAHNGTITQNPTENTVTVQIKT